MKHGKCCFESFYTKFEGVFETKKYLEVWGFLRLGGDAKQVIYFMWPKANFVFFIVGIDIYIHSKEPFFPQIINMKRLELGKYY